LYLRVWKAVKKLKSGSGMDWEWVKKGRKEGKSTKKLS